MNYLWIDTETGGLNAKHNPILTIGLVVTDENFNILYKNELKIKNKYNLHCSKTALKINKIDLNTHEKTALDPTEIIKTIESIKSTYFDNRPIIIGQNLVNFDLNFIKELYKRENNTFEYFYAIDTLHCFRLLRMTRVIKSNGSSIESLSEYFGLTPQTHSALDDILHTIDLIKILKKLKFTKINK